MLPPSVDLKIWLMSLWGKPPPPSLVAGEIQHPVAREVACDLHITDEWGWPGATWYRSVPRQAVITGVGDGKGHRSLPQEMYMRP